MVYGTWENVTFRLLIMFVHAQKQIVEEWTLKKTREKEYEATVAQKSPYDFSLTQFFQAFMWIKILLVVLNWVYVPSANLGLIQELQIMWFLKRGSWRDVT